MDNYISINEIIRLQIATDTTNNKFIYKQNPFSKASRASQADMETPRDLKRDRFFAIKISQQKYQGKSATVIFMHDATKKINAKISSMK